MLKKSLSIITFSLLLLFAIFYFYTSNISSTVGAKPTDDNVRLVVKFKDGTQKVKNVKKVKDLTNKFHGRHEDDTDTDKSSTFEVNSTDKDAVVAQLSTDSTVDFVEVDQKVGAFFDSNDTYFGLQWGLNNIGQNIVGTPGLLDADIDYPETTFTPKPGAVLVAVLDTGINANQEDLVGKIVKSVNFAGTNTGTQDIVGHGTHVAGIIAANSNNGKGIAGACPSCQLMNVKVLDDTGSGYMSNVANGIIWAADNGAKVINMSLGSSSRSNYLEYAILYAASKNVVIVAAAGNSGNTNPMYPAAYPNVIAVAATNNQDTKASFSSYGSTWVDVAAPGQYIASTWNRPGNGITCATPNSCYVYLSGTSMASPFVAGIAGDIWASSYGTSAVDVRARLESTTDPIVGTGSFWSKGRVNLANAVAVPVVPVIPVSQ